MHVHIGGGIVLLLFLGIIGIIFAITFAISHLRRGATGLTPPAPSPRSTPPAPLTHGYMSSGYPASGYGSVPSYMPPAGPAAPAPSSTSTASSASPSSAGSGIGAGTGFLAGMAAGALLDEALTSRHDTIVEVPGYGGDSPVLPIEEVPSAPVTAPGADGGFWSFNIDTDAPAPDPAPVPDAGSGSGPAGNDYPDSSYTDSGSHGGGSDGGYGGGSDTGGGYGGSDSGSGGSDSGSGGSDSSW